MIWHLGLNAQAYTSIVCMFAYTYSHMYTWCVDGCSIFFCLSRSLYVYYLASTHVENNWVINWNNILYGRTAYIAAGSIESKEQIFAKNVQNV